MFFTARRRRGSSQSQTTGAGYRRSTGSLDTSFYGLKQITGNLPADAPPEAAGTIAHAAGASPPVRLDIPGIRAFM